MMTEACGATNCTMMEMGGATSSMMKMRGATKSTSRNYIRLIFIFMVIDKRLYILLVQRICAHIC